MKVFNADVLNDMLVSAAADDEQRALSPQVCERATPQDRAVEGYTIRTDRTILGVYQYNPPDPSPQRAPRTGNLDDSAASRRGRSPTRGPSRTTSGASNAVCLDQRSAI